MERRQHRATGRPRGRPTKEYTLEQMEQIIFRVASGETLTKVCSEPGMPHYTTFRHWLLKDEELNEKWLRAKELRAHAIFDEMIDLSRELVDGEPTAVRVNAVRVAVETLRHAAARLSPKDYGERVEKNTLIPIQIITSLDLGQGGSAQRIAGNKVFTVEVEAEGPRLLEAPKDE